MRKIDNISDLQIGKIYYIDVAMCFLSVSMSYPAMKLRGKLVDENEKYLSFMYLEYINEEHYKDIKYPQGKPHLLRLIKHNKLLYRVVNSYLSEDIKYQSPSTIYEPENERLLTNFVMRNGIIGDPYFDVDSILKK